MNLAIYGMGYASNGGYGSGMNTTKKEEGNNLRDNMRCRG